MFTTVIYTQPYYKDKNWLYNSYIINEVSIFDMADNSSVSPNTILQWLKYYKIPICPIDDSCIYFLLSKDTNRVKIGFSTNLSIRIKDLILMNGSDLELIAYKLGNQSDEAELHRFFISDRLYGEWFNYSIHIKKYIESLKLDSNQLMKMKNIITDIYKNQQFKILRATYKSQEYTKSKIKTMIKDCPGITMYKIMKMLEQDTGEFITIGKVQNVVNSLEDNNIIISEYKDGKRLLYVV